MCGPKFCSMHINRAVEEFNAKTVEEQRPAGKRALPLTSMP
jgi:phosphomethylpyrimidine synthase